jgi:hypothetical protein
MIEVRPSTLRDLIEHCGDLPPYRVRAFTGLMDGAVIAIGGIAYLPNGNVLAFLDADDAARTKGKLSLYKTAKRLIEECRARGITTINAMQQIDIEAAEPFLKRLGFRLSGPDNRIFVLETRGVG